MYCIEFYYKRCKRDMYVMYVVLVFLNPDGLTQFGMPWEMRLMHNYLVRRKGGNIRGYTTLFSFVPELQLGK